MILFAGKTAIDLYEYLLVASRYSAIYTTHSGHRRVFRDTFSQPCEAHTTGLSSSGIANQLNTENVPILVVRNPHANVIAVYTENDPLD